jgi:nucleotide-binding universal stress UspA family protein
MTRVHSILCAVDCSEHARRAFEYAFALAASHRARLTVLTAIDPLLAEAASVSSDQDYVRETRVELGAFSGAASLDQVPWTPTPRLVVSIGEPGAQILEAAEFHEADLIVMGAQGLGGCRRLGFGSTTERVLRHTTTPVLVVPLGDTPLVTLQRTGPTFQVATVVAGIDFRAGTTALARLASSITAEFHARLVLAHVVQPVQGTARWQQSLELANSLHRETAQAAMETLVGHLDPALPVDAVTITGHPADALTTLAADRTAGALVIGTGSGEDGSHRPGSTAQRIISAAQVPVLVVPPTSADRMERERQRTASHAPAWPAGDATRSGDARQRPM